MLCRQFTHNNQITSSALDEWHTTHNTSVLQGDQTLNAKYTLQSYFNKVERENNK